ncbi:hypothetical protein [Legionella resiliens]|uniref:Uncharacterized protein n=1 Tax=Legionella resiliens TaxID=2905958 RepID=A0ABS8WWY5_9GAMM|nr:MULTISPECIES: hypothetical protein [unclassified Legionella]MCE0721841.1 hypothetical protein [Legionella sp. 9fVS26]MCE3530995.1 hypothetical protein [Legionella sp. 8cVS16]
MKKFLAYWSKRRGKSVTDLKLLKTIYNAYYNDYITLFNNETKERETKIYVPIDIDKLSNQLKMDSEIFHQRLYTHLEKEFGHEDKHLFVKKLVATIIV